MREDPELTAAEEAAEKAADERQRLASLKHWADVAARKPEPAVVTAPSFIVLPSAQAKPKAKPKAKVRKSTGSWATYRGSKRDRSGDPYWDMTPTNIRLAVADGRLEAVDMSVAGVIYRHIRKSARYRDKGKRIARPEIARLLGLSVSTVGLSLGRMVAAGELIIVSPGKWNQNGAIYGFPARAVSEHDDR
jgi:hypothetical protein